MSSVVKAFENAFKVKEERSWDMIAVAIDLHGTVVKPTYNHKLADELYPSALKCLQYMTRRKDLLMYMYSCTPGMYKDGYSTLFTSNNIQIYESHRPVHEAMNVKGNVYQDFSEKPYFNVLLEDKAGFDPEKDWALIYDYLIANE